jgi:hypothetical protein
VTDPGSDTGKQAIDTVVRTFTEAELALTEVAGAIERFRAASDQLLDASERQESASMALAASTEASQAIAIQLGAVVQSLSQAADALRAIEPERLWTHLEQVEADRKSEGIFVRGELAGARRRTSQVLRVAIAGAIAGLAATVLLVLIVTGVVSLR